MGRVLVPTGVAIQLPGPEYVALVCARSGLAVKRGLTLSNGVGVIDSDYRGAIQVGLVNLSTSPAPWTRAERVAQLMVMPVGRCAFTFAEKLDETHGRGGLRLTGRL